MAVSNEALYITWQLKVITIFNTNDDLVYQYHTNNHYVDHFRTINFLRNTLSTKK